MGEATSMGNLPIHADSDIGGRAWISLRGCALLLAAFILPNLPFWIAARFIQVNHRGMFNADYVLAVVLCLFGARAFGGAVLVFAMVCDTLRNFDSIYHFTQQDVLYSVIYVRAVPVSVIAPVAGLIVVGIALVALLWFKLVPAISGDGRAKVALVLVSIVVVLKGVDTLHGLNGYVQVRESAKSVRSVSESVVGFAVNVRGMFGTPPPAVHLESASMKLFDQASYSSADATGDAPNVVLIVVESMGVSSGSQGVYEHFLSPSVTSRYLVETGKVHFFGGTVSGEYRELCGMTSGARIREQELARKAQCLPELMKARGFETEGIHGFEGRMFARQSWYSAIGFQRTTFLEQMDRMPGMHICGGVFPGICDADIASYIGTRLRAGGKKKFIHWVTLNTHLPIERNPREEELCRQADERDVCELDLLLGRTLHAIAELATQEDLPPTEFIVVGDHAPPFATLARRSKFDQANVPFVRLTPRAVAKELRAALGK